MVERVEPEAMIDWIDRRISSALTWLDDHGRTSKKPWPEHVIEAKEYDIDRFREIRTAYVKAWERKKAAEENEQGRSVSTVA